MSKGIFDVMDKKWERTKKDKRYFKKGLLEKDGKRNGSLIKYGVFLIEVKFTLVWFPS